MQKKIISTIIVFSVFLQILPVVYAGNDTVEIQAVENRLITISGEADEKTSITVLYPDCEDIALTADNFKSSVVYTTQVDEGEYSKSFFLPKDAPVGTYTIKKVGATTQTSTFDYGVAFEPKVLYSENFDNQYLWTVENMLVKDGALLSTTEKSAWASLKITEDAKFKDAKIEMKFSISGSSANWLQVRFRNSEGLLIRRERICRYTDSREQNSKPCSLEDGRIYSLEIIANGNDMSVKVYNEDKTEEVFSNTYTADYTGAGGLSISTFGVIGKVYDLKVSNVYDEALYFKEIITPCSVGETKLLDIESKLEKPEIKYSSSDENVVTVANDGSITAVANGEACITATADNYTAKCSVVVYTPPKNLELYSKKYAEVTLNPGENIGVRVKAETNANLSGLVWESSDENVASVFGNAYSARTICAENEGVAKVIVKLPNTDVKTEIIVRVMPDNNEGTINASFSAAEDNRKIKPYSYGTFGNPRKISNDEINHENTKYLGYNIIRTFGVGLTGDFTADHFEIANDLDLPQVVVLPMASRTEGLQSVENILKQVGQINQFLEENETLYIEFGNELYDGTVGIDDYLPLLKAAYTAVKEEYPHAKIAVPVYCTIRDADWNNRLFESDNQYYYDAIVLHNYSTFQGTDGIDGKNQEDAMTFLYANQNYHKAIIDKYTALAPTKDLWITEYGNLILTLFHQNDQSERGRMQFAKSVGFALSDMEHILNTISNEKIDIANFYPVNDAQGLGIVQGETKLPSYYVVEEISNILKTCDYIYEVEPIQVGQLTKEKSIINSSHQYTDNIGAWGFGDEESQKYVIFSNRTPNEANISLNGKKLKKLWSYGGDDEILGDYLNNVKEYGDAPDVIPTPTTYSSDFTDTLTMDKYQIVVCEVEDSNENISVSCNATLNGGRWDFNQNGDFQVAIGDASAAPTIVLMENKTEVSSNITNTSNIYSVVPNGGFKFDTNYVLEVTVGGKKHKFEFTTIRKPFYENFTSDAEDEFGSPLTSYFKWNYTTNHWKISGGKLKKSVDYNSSISLKDKTYKDFVIDFDFEVTDDFITDNLNYATVSMRGGDFRIFSNGILRSYYNGINDRFIGQHEQFIPGKTYKIRFIAYGNTIYVYMKNVNDANYTYVGCQNGVATTPKGIAFNGEGQYYIDNFVVKNNKTIFADIDIKQGDISVYGLTGGDNKMTVTLSDDISADYELFGALYNNGKFVEWLTSTQVDNTNQHEIDFSVDTFNNSLLKLFLWDSFENIKPLEKPFILE